MEVPAGDELLDLVDDEDRVVGQILRSEVRNRDLNHVRVVNAFVKNSRGQIWIPRRSAAKRSHPLGLDMSMGGYVGSGETYDEAFRREMQEELRIDVGRINYKMLGHTGPQDGFKAFMQVYEMEQDEAPDFNKEDFVEYFWLTPQEVLDKIAAGDDAKSDLPKLVRRFYL